MIKHKLTLNEDTLTKNIIRGNYLMALVNPKLPGAFKRGDKFTSKPKYIIIHDSNCLNHTDAALITTSREPTVGNLKINNIVKNGDDDYNYHFIVDKIGDDYEVIAGRPMNIHCHFDNIDKAYEDSIHVIILCDLNVDMPDNRLYKILAYRCLAPLVKMLKIASDPSKAVFFHDEIETKSDKRCPGDFLAKELLLSQIRRYL